MLLACGLSSYRCLHANLGGSACRGNGVAAPSWGDWLNIDDLAPHGAAEPVVGFGLFAGQVLTAALLGQAQGLLAAGLGLGRGVEVLPKHSALGVPCVPA